MFLSFHLQGEAVYLFRLQKYIKKMNSVTNGGKIKLDIPDLRSTIYSIQQQFNKENIKHLSEVKLS